MTQNNVIEYTENPHDRDVSSERMWIRGKRVFVTYLPCATRADVSTDEITIESAIRSVKRYIHICEKNERDWQHYLMLWKGNFKTFLAKLETIK